MILWELRRDIRVEKEGRRVYFQFPFNRNVLNTLKGMGAKWEPATKRWWMGSTNRRLDNALEYFKEEMERSYGQAANLPRIVLQGAPDIRLIEQLNTFEFEFPYDPKFMGELKRLGARWRPQKKVWAITKGEPGLKEAVEKFKEYIEAQKEQRKRMEALRLEIKDRYRRKLSLRVPYQFEDEAESLGALYDADRKLWLFPDTASHERFRDKLRKIREEEERQRAEQERRDIAQKAEKVLGRPVDPSELKRLNFSGPTRSSQPNVGKVVYESRSNRNLLEIVYVGRAERITDGMSFGFNFDDGYSWTAWAVPATGQKKQDFEQREKARDDKNQAIRGAQELGRLIKRDGVQPTDHPRITEERLAILNKDHILYGGGSWFHIEGSSRIWYIENHGADGDDWGHNNIGGRYRGWYIPYDPEVADNIKKWHVAMGHARIASRIARRFANRRGLR